MAKQADWVVDLGPGGGDAGGAVVFAGTPEALAEADTPTAVFMREELTRHAEEEVGARTRAIDLDAFAGDDEAGDEDVEEDEAAEAGEA